MSEAQNKAIPLIFTVKDAKTEAQGELVTWTRQQAVRKGMILAGWVFVVGIVMIPIPIIHFMCPIIFLIFTPLTGFMTFKLFNGAMEVDGTGSCPQCTGPVTMVRKSAKWPIQILCPHCSTSISVQRG